MSGIGIKDYIFNQGAGWLGDLGTDRLKVSDSDLNSDYLAIVVERDLNAGINPIESIQNHYKELAGNPIESWLEFTERLDLLPVI